MTSMEAMFAKYSSILTPAAAAAASKSFLASGGTSKLPAATSTSFGEDDADATPTSASSATAGSGAAFSATAASAAAGSKKSGASKRKKTKEANGVDPAKAALVNAHIAKAAADRKELHMIHPITEQSAGVMPQPDERIQHTLIGFTEIGEPHMIDITSKLSPTALTAMRPKGSEAPIRIKVQLYSRTVKYYHDMVIPYVTEQTVFQLTQFLLSPDEWSPKFFVDTVHREHMRVRGSAEDTHERDVFGCRLWDLIASLRRLEVFGKKAYSVFVGAERKSTLLLKKEGLVWLVKTLETLLAPYDISALHADAHKPAPVMADDIDKAVEAAFAPEAPAAAAAITAVAAAPASVPAPAPRFVAKAQPVAASSISKKAAAATAKDRFDSDSDTEASDAALATLAAAASASKAAALVPAPVVVRNTLSTAVVVEDDSEPQEAEEPSPKRLRPTALPPVAPAAAAAAAPAVAIAAAPVPAVAESSSKDEKMIDETESGF